LKKYTLQKPKICTKCKRILFIVGCQRSGTTLMLRIFRNDQNVKTFGEHSRLSSNDEYKIRLNPLHLVKKDIGKVRESLIVLKPLVESQRTPKLLDYFEESKAVWMYRDYKDVASSNLFRFGVKNGINDLRPIAENTSGNWRSDNISKSVREIIASHFSENMNPYDAAVLFWYARNRLYFDLGLDKDPNVLLCPYERLITNPAQIIKTIYRGLDQDYPGSHLHEEIHSNSVNKGENIILSPSINQLAAELLSRMNKTNQLAINSAAAKTNLKI